MDSNNWTTQRGKKFFITIPFDKWTVCFPKFDVLGCNYAYILHTETETKHYHLLLDFTKRISRSRVDSLLCDIFSWNKNDPKHLNAVQIDFCLDYLSCFQYLIHKNDSSKYQYDESEIISNLDTNIVHNYIINSKIDITLTTESLIDYINLSSTKVDLIKYIGLVNYSSYRWTINDLWSELK